MNINEPSFPSGISLARAKKDAKKLKKLEDITLTQALNRVAQQTLLAKSGIQRKFFVKFLHQQSRD